MAAIAGLLGFFAAGATVTMASGAAAGAAPRGEPSATTSTTAVTEYFVDLMFRPRDATASASGQTPGPAPADTATVGSAPSGIQPTISNETRAEATRILARAITQGKLDESDRAYFARVVSARTGLSPDEAQRRVAEVEIKAREAVKETADKAAKAGAYFSFWTFMSLLFGGVAATLAGMLGGQLRDAEGRLA